MRAQLHLGLMGKRVLLSILLVLAWPSEAIAADPPVRPIIRAGEVLTYRVHSSRFGNIGTAVMRVDEDTAQGQPAYRLSFTFKGRVMLFKVSDETQSWIDPTTFSSLRYRKRERTPIGSRDEAVEVMPTRGAWSDEHGTHPIASEAPLDELAFIYFARGLPAAFEEMNLTRHFDQARNPVVFQQLPAETVTALGGDSKAIVIEMHVPDARQKKGRSSLRFYISEDADRLPLRIDSSMPMAGTMTLTLQSVEVGR